MSFKWLELEQLPAALPPEDHSEECTDSSCYPSTSLTFPYSHRWGKNVCGYFDMLVTRQHFEESFMETVKWIYLGTENNSSD